MKKIYILISALLSTIVSYSQSCLLIYDVNNSNTSALVTALQNAGISVTLSSTNETGYDGTNPSPAGFSAVIHLNGTTYNTDMPIAGQNALVNYVQNQGGVFISGEWNAYEFGQGRMANMRNLLLFNRSGGGTGSLTYTTVSGMSGHPVLAGVTSGFTFSEGYNNGSMHTFGSQPATLLMTDNFGNGAVAYRQFGNGQVVGFNHAANYSGATSLSNTNVQQLYINAVRLGKQKAALNFDGSNDRVSIPHKSYQVGMSALTLEAWVYITGTSGNFRNIIMKGNYGYGMAIDFNNKLGYWSDPSYSNCPRTAASIPFNTWTHVAVVVNQGISTTFYINGVNAGSSTSSGHTTINSGSNDPLFLGYQGTGCNCNYFQGSMDEVHVWNSARTASQILAGMNCSLGSATNLIANYDFNNGNPGATNTGKDSLADLSGNWNKGTLLNFALTGSTSNWASPAIGHEIDVTGNGIGILDGDITPSVTDSTNFGTVSYGTVRRYTIKNIGAATLNISSIVVSGTNATEFVLSGVPSYVSANSSAIFYVTFKPTVAATNRTATITINTNDCDESIYDYSIQGQSPSIPGAALNFDGSSDNIRAAHNPILNPSSAMTLEAWVYRTASQYSTIVAKWDDDNNNRGYMINFGELGNNNKLCFVATNTGNWLPFPKIQWETNTALNLNQWYHVAITFTQSGTNNIKYYLNGTLTDQTTWNFSINSTNPIDLLIGGYDGPGNGQNVGANSRYFAGTLDEVRIWNRALCQSEIQNNMNCEIATSASGLIANYHFNQGVASGSNGGVTSLTDASGNSITGTLNTFGLSGTSSNWTAPGAVSSGVSCAAFLAPEIQVTGNSLDISDNDITPVVADFTDFGSVNNGFARTFTINNLGSATLNISSATISGAHATDFTLGSLPSSIIAGGTANFTVTFSSATPNSSRNAVVEINSNDCDEPLFNYSITAKRLLPTPGAVSSNLSVWLKGNSSAYTDNGITIANPGQLVQQWNDASTNALVFRQTATANKPTLVNSINFNPTLEFFGDQYIDLLTSLGIGGTQDYTYYTVFMPKAITNGGSLDDIGSYILDRQSVTQEMVNLKFINSNNLAHQFRYDNGSGLGSTSSGSLLVNNVYIAQQHRDYNVEFGLAVNGGVKTTSADNTNSLVPPPTRVGRHVTNTNGGLTGELGEVIIYGMYPTATELQRINSYLAVKYGVTLDQTAGQNYLNSAGAVVYNSGAGGTFDVFDKDITGIGRDDATALDQRQSKSVNANSMLTIGNGSVAVNNASNPNAFSVDNSYFVAGHNGLDASSQATSDFGTSFNPGLGANEAILGRLNRYWGSQETGTVGSLRLQFDMSKVFGVAGLNSNDLQHVRLLVDADGTFATGATAVSPVSYNNISGIVEFDWNFAAGTGFYFTIGTVNNTLTPLPVDLVYFNAKRAGENSAKLDWKLINDAKDLESIEVQRSTNAMAFEPIAMVAPSNTELYTYNDRGLEYGNIYYYRLKLKHTDQSVVYSAIKAVNIEWNGEEKQVSVFPNPANDVVFITNPSETDNATYSFVDATGRTSLSGSLAVGINSINSSGLNNGMYFVQVKNGDTKTTFKISINH